MGRATIISHVGDGLYLIRPEYDRSKLDAELEKLDREDADNEPLRQRLLLEVGDQISVVAQKEGELNEAIQIDKVQPSGETETGRMVGGITSEDGTVLVDSVKIPDLPTVSSAVMDATVAFAIESKKLAALKQRRSEVDAGYIERQKRRNMLNAERDRITNSAIEAWCADYTLTLSPGQLVNTIEVPGYRLKGEPSMNIAPYYEDAGDSMKCGQLRSALTMTPEMVFLNAALEPGHLKWSPRWRYGQITAISSGEDTCSVTLEQEWGRRAGDAPKMPLNEQESLDNVPIRYMDCNSAVFTNGDWVIVEWKDGEPAVVGFRSEPRQCRNIAWILKAAWQLDWIYWIEDPSANIGYVLKPNSMWEPKDDSLWNASGVSGFRGGHGVHSGRIITTNGGALWDYDSDIRIRRGEVYVDGVLIYHDNPEDKESLWMHVTASKNSLWISNGNWPRANLTRLNTDDFSVINRFEIGGEGQYEIQHIGPYSGGVVFVGVDGYNGGSVFVGKISDNGAFSYKNLGYGSVGAVGGWGDECAIDFRPSSSVEINTPEIHILDVSSFDIIRTLSLPSSQEYEIVNGIAMTEDYIFVSITPYTLQTSDSTPAHIYVYDRNDDYSMVSNWPVSRAVNGVYYQLTGVAIDASLMP